MSERFLRPFLEKVTQQLPLFYLLSLLSMLGAKCRRKPQKSPNFKITVHLEPMQIAYILGDSLSPNFQ